MKKDSMLQLQWGLAESSNRIGCALNTEPVYDE
jgi:hypothetical protein